MENVQNKEWHNKLSNDSYRPPEGYLGNLTEAQQKAFNETKASLKDVLEPTDQWTSKHYDDVRICRFMRARNWNVEKSLQMIREDIKWRTSFGTNDITKTFPENPNFKAITSYWPGKAHALDHNQAEVWWERIGCVDAKSYCDGVSREDSLKFHVWTMERAEQRLYVDASERLGVYYQEGGTFIYDLNGLGWKHFHTPALNVVKEIAATDEAHYPELVRKIYIVNAPSIFGVFWKILQPVLDKKTQEKIEVLGGNYKDVLAKEFGAENIPVYFGGPSTKGDIPNPGLFGSASNDHEKPVEVTVKDKHEVEFNVGEGYHHEINSMIGWKFQTESKDVGFSVVFHKPGSKDIRELHPYERMPQHEGSVVATETGRYVLTWDNSFSLFTKKKVTYQLFVQPPLDDSLVNSMKETTLSNTNPVTATENKESQESSRKIRSSSSSSSNSSTSSKGKKEKKRKSKETK